MRVGESLPERWENYLLISMIDTYTPVGYPRFLASLRLLHRVLRHLQERSQTKKTSTKCHWRSRLNGRSHTLTACTSSSGRTAC
jgi:hypothetical protein